MLLDINTPRDGVMTPREPECCKRAMSQSTNNDNASSTEFSFGPLRFGEEGEMVVLCSSENKSNRSSSGFDLVEVLRKVLSISHPAFRMYESIIAEPRFVYSSEERLCNI